MYFSMRNNKGCFLGLSFCLLEKGPESIPGACSFSQRPETGGWLKTRKIHTRENDPVYRNGMILFKQVSTIVRHLVC